jgi:conjugative transposon TraM protein
MKQEKFKDPRKRKMLLVLPWLVIPFLTMAFWAMGGGATDKLAVKMQSAGLNLQLPNAQLKDDKGENKLSYYEEAERDSLKWRAAMGNDPFFSSALNDSLPKSPAGYNTYPFHSEEYKDPNEQRVYQKLAELNRHLQGSDRYSANSSQLNTNTSSYNTSFDKGDISHLEEVMKNAGSQTTKDPEVDQLNSMMDRILDIQHPERVKQKLEEMSYVHEPELLPVKRSQNDYSVSLLDTAKDRIEGGAFYSVDTRQQGVEQNTVQAVIHESQTLINGSIVKIRLLDDVIVSNTIIDKGHFVFGTASLAGERLHIEINAIRKDNCIYPVKLAVFDLDGMEGIHIPGAMARDVAKESVDNSLQNIGMPAIEPSLKVQATTAGINASKSLLTKKAKLVRVIVKAGYKVLLKEKKDQ